MNTLTVGGFSRACIAVLSAAVTLTACSSHEERRATPEKTVPATAPQGTDDWAKFATDIPQDSAGKVYMGICLMDLRVPTEAGGEKGPNFDALQLFDNDPDIPTDDKIVGVITGTSGGHEGRFGIAIIPRNGNGTKIVKWNLDTLEANQMLTQHGLCPA